MTDDTKPPTTDRYTITRTLRNGERIDHPRTHTLDEAADVARS